MQQEYKDNEWSFFTKELGGGWYNWDHQVFGWTGRHIFLVSIVLLICICVLIICVWLVGWKLATRAQIKDIKGFQSPRLQVWQKSD